MIAKDFPIVKDPQLISCGSFTIMILERVRRLAALAVRNFGRRNRAPKFRKFHNFALVHVETP